MSCRNMTEEMVIKIEPPDYLDEETFESLPSTSSGLLLNEESTSDHMMNEIKVESREAIDESLDAFYFESDHPALKDNEDYRRILKAVTVLEAQRAQAIKDLDKLYELKEKALADPIAFVERLQRGEKMNFPGPQELYQLPVIDWNKYNINNATTAFGRRQLTRHSTKAAQDLIKNSMKSKSGKQIDQKPLKSTNYWTAEEQKHLEELLVQFPPEDVESRRWEKIAKGLGNRTPIQVASRVQKYFIKLMKAGMPIPGRMPNMQYIRKPRRNVIRQQPSTFMVSHTLPVFMPEGDDDYSYSFHNSSLTPDENSLESKADFSDDEEINPEVRNSSEFQELLLLKKVQKEKLLNRASTQHIGFKCCHCKSEPIVGVRWHCAECKPPISIDFCDNCVDSLYEIGQHSSNHKLEEIRDASTSFLDRDYTDFLGSDYYYLNPKYVPAS